MVVPVTYVSGEGFVKQEKVDVDRWKLISDLPESKKRLSLPLVTPVIHKWANHYFLFVSLKKELQACTDSTSGGDAYRSTFDVSRNYAIAQGR